ncbi:MAG: methionine gamma-lyase family protein [Oscillospiraceae bacterium]|nr:methionine gamma-lyase family protein [Oscillospiraceae bacterium]
MDFISDKIRGLAASVERGCADEFARIDRIAEVNTEKVMEAFRAERVSDSFFAGTTGYGYNDRGREALDAVYARIFGAPSALVRIGFANGTHAIAAALYAAVGPGDTLLSITGAPYDTLRGVIGPDRGSLEWYGVKYEETQISDDGEPDLADIAEKAPRAKAVFIQRSRGYTSRRAYTTDEIGRLIAAVRQVNPDAAIIVDNCYGEFVCETEPTQVGADLIAGSLIKNPGGGLAPTGGYVAGREDLVEAAAERLTVPGIGGEVGATLGQSRLLFQGLFMAPHVVAQAVKTAAFAARLFSALGFDVSPGPGEARGDIIQTLRFGDPEKLKKFCLGVQQGAPVDSFVTPEPWPMPGYDCDVIMAAGAFVQGASIELSADAPMRDPYIAYLQGGLTYESGKLGIMRAATLIAE